LGDWARGDYFGHSRRARDGPRSHVSNTDPPPGSPRLDSRQQPASAGVADREVAASAPTSGTQIGPRRPKLDFPFGSAEGRSGGQRRVQRSALRPDGRRTRGGLGDEARHSLLARHVVSDAHPSPLRGGPCRSRPSCPRGSRLRSVRPRSARRAPRRERVFAVRVPALPRSAARPRCRLLARIVRNREAPCQCR
jgi:hypothetical protein